MNKYTVTAKIVSVVMNSKDDYYVCFQRLDTIDDMGNPFYGKRKMAVATLNKFGMKQLMQIWGTEKVSKMINKCVFLEMVDDGTIFHKVEKIKKNPTFNFRTWPCSLPKFVMTDVKLAAMGEMTK